MAFVAEVRARLGLDTTPFSRGLTKAQADVGKAAADMGGKLRRAFGAGDVFRGLLQGIGIGVLTSLDVITEVQRGLLSFTKISDPILRPMTLALCTASARTPSYAAGIALQEIENGFPQLSYPISIDGPAMT